MHRVVIIGSGFGGLFGARALRRAPVQVTVIDRANHHLFQPLLYQVATGILSEGNIAPATRDVLRYHRNTSVQLATVTDIDLRRRVVTARQRGRVIETPYDSLIVSAGVETSYFGHPEFAEWAPGMKSIDDALELRARIFGAFEMAETEPDAEARRGWLTFVVVGGGPTGVEMAGQIAELSHRSLQRNFRRIDPRDARVLLFEGGDRVLAPFGDRISRITARDLGRLGVEVHTGAMVTGMDAGSVQVRLADGSASSVVARTKIWAAGMAASPLGRLLADASGADLDRMGRVKVNPDCTLPGHPEVFVVGDLMALGDLPGMAEVAMQSSVHAARLIKRRLAGDHADRPFHYRDLGMLATISRFRAVARIGGMSIGGFVGWLLWLVVHLTFLTGFKNRVGALAYWAVSFVGRGRAERTITFHQLAARQALATLDGRLPRRDRPQPATDAP
ncbi:MAG TPA: NAD(P)/FAD-dependent oxidoreductase [Acidimicrobiales bacterium]|nr:NAD(P)/FAD-dependent oxidoreductase [Acidimicrobiales bacterium]